jgi:hypothetical protein
VDNKGEETVFGTEESALVEETWGIPCFEILETHPLITLSLWLFTERLEDSNRDFLTLSEELGKSRVRFRFATFVFDTSF